MNVVMDPIDFLRLVVNSYIRRSSERAQQAPTELQPPNPPSPIAQNNARSQNY